MVANRNMNDDFQSPKTLGYWVKQFRSKKKEMKRRLNSGGNLRMCAILTTALMTAELELQRKQQERIQKWFKLQSKIEENCEIRHRQSKNIDEESSKQRLDIDNLWKCELSDLDKFMRSISSSSNKELRCDKENQLHSVRVSS